MQRSLSLDILKLVLTMMVIAIHTFFLTDVNEELSYLFVNGLFRIAVPIFFVVNGYYFTRFLQTPFPWLKRGLILYLVWMLIYSYYWFLPSGTGLSSLVQTAKAIVVGYEHLWYVASMLGAAALLYCLRHLSSKLLLGLSVGLYLVGVSIQYLGNYHVFKDPMLDRLCNALWLYRSTLLFAFPFFCIGHLLGKHQIHKKIQPSHNLMGLVFGLALVAVESYLNFHSQPKREGFDVLFSLLLVAPLAFILFLNLNIKSETKTIAIYSTAIYLIHFFVVLQLRDSTNIHGSALTLTVILISIAISWVLVRINRRVRYLL